MTLLPEDRERLARKLDANRRCGVTVDDRLTDEEKHKLIREEDTAVEGPPTTAGVAQRGPFDSPQAYHTRDRWDDTLCAAGVTSPAELVAEWVGELDPEDALQFYAREVAADLPIGARRAATALTQLADAPEAWNRALMDGREVEREHHRGDGSGPIRWRVVL
jgi:hypothetical protein